MITITLASGKTVKGKNLDTIATRLYGRTTVWKIKDTNSPYVARITNQYGREVDQVVRFDYRVTCEVCGELRDGFDNSYHMVIDEDGSDASHWLD